MARISQPLTLSEIKKAKPKDKLYKLFDGAGLYIVVHPSGKKVWRYDYTDRNKKRQTHTIGDFEFIGLAEARQERTKLREKLFRYKSIKQDNKNAFSDVFNDWFTIWARDKSKSHSNRARVLFDKYVAPNLGNVDINEITTRDLVVALEKIDRKGARELLNKAKSALNLCFSYAIAKGICESNPVAVIDNSVFSKQVKTNYRHLNITEIYKLHSLFDKGALVLSRLCIEFMIRNLSRPSESAGLEWSEWDDDKKIITIKPKRMKMRNDHMIPISSQSIGIIDKMKENYSGTKYIFPNESFSSHLKRSTLNAIVSHENIDSTPHGFRHLASTILNESGLFDSDVIEACLAHQDKNSIRATYNKAQYIEKRRELLQWWSDFIDLCQDEESNLEALRKFNVI